MEELITANLDIWSAAVTAKASGAGRSSGNKGAYGINKLRELILELAVRGKLVPQDANDAPASELLKRIQAEKVKSKRNKAIPSIIDEEMPFEVPHSWKWEKLGNLCLLENGDRSKNYPNKSVLVATGLPFVNAGHLINGKINRDDMSFITKERYDLLSGGKFFNGDILFCLRGSLGKSAIVEGFETGAIASSLVIVRIYPYLCHEYFVKYFDSPLTYQMIRKYDNGTAQPNLSAADLGQFLIPIPPLLEQHRIVAKVDELMALCDQLETEQANSAEAHKKLVSILLDALTQGDNFTESWARLQEHFDVLFTTPASIDKLKQTLLQLAVMGKLVPQDPNDEPASELFKRVQTAKNEQTVNGGTRKQKELGFDALQSPPFDIPEGWEWRYMDDLFFITGGVTLGRKLANQKLISKPYLRVANVQRGSLELDHIKEIEVPVAEIEKYALKAGDLLITEGGDWDKVGRTAIWNNELPECLHQNHVFRVRPLVPEWVSRWSEMYLNSNAAREYFAGASKQTTNLASINMTQLRGCAHALPPLAEQHRIVAKVDELMALCDQLKSRLVEAGEQQRKLADVMVERAMA